MKLENRINKPFSYLGNIQEISLRQYNPNKKTFH